MQNAFHISVRASFLKKLFRRVGSPRFPWSQCIASVFRQFFGVYLLLFGCTGGMNRSIGAETNWISPIIAPQAFKVITQYALTSANDFPQRDPKDWRLLASNDGGQNWTTLDSRKGELFSERHQRRVFALANHAAFNVYRLQIDRVRDPSGADSVQLAEIEAMGETQEDLDPPPTVADLITAQGAKFPVETAYSAFDGEIETKWLDFAVQ